MRMCSIASGSSGNCIYIGSGSSHILIDAGISGKRVEAGLKDLDLKGTDVNGILITHEHSDHIRGLGVLARKYEIPIYATPGTAAAIRGMDGLGKIEEGLFVEIGADASFFIGDLKISPFRISHDAAEPVAYKISHGKQKGAVVTDLGVYDDYIVEHLRDMDILFLEANHDVNMLEVGPYPYPLKRRIMGARGHLSNETSGKLLCRILHDNLKAIVLSHLSKENNLPELAYETVRTEVTMSELPYKGGDFPLYVAKRSELSEAICI